MKNHPILFVVGALFLAAQAYGAVSHVYVAQSATGSGNGASCSSAYGISFLTTYGNWGGGAAQIGAGSTVHLCGTITTQFPVSNSGTASSPITVKFEPGARLSVPYCVSSGGTNPSGCIDLQGNNYIVVDGGTPCGPSTGCSATDSGTGIIEATANGSSLANRQDGTGIAINNGIGIEIKNIIIRNIYRHTSTTDTTGGRDTSAVRSYNSGCNGCSFHDSTIHDAFSGYNALGAKDSNLSVYNNYIYNTNWGIYRGTSRGNTQTNISFHDNRFGSVSNWDDTVNNNNHHDRIFMPDSVAGEGDFDGVYIYNNLFDGTSGCCSTAMMYWGGGSQKNTYVFNNVFDDRQGTTTMNALLELTGGSATSVWVYNNTLVGAPGVEDNCVQLEGTARFVNNIVTGCATAVLIKTGTSLPQIDYNTYAGGNSAKVWQTNSGSTNIGSLAAWRTATGGEQNSTYVTALAFGSDGLPLPISANGANLTSSCVNGVAPLCSDTTAGATRTATPRSGSARWATGAYNSASSQTAVPIPQGVQATAVASSQ